VRHKVSIAKPVGCTTFSHRVRGSPSRLRSGSGAPNGTGFTAISSNDCAFAALNATGTVHAWGDGHCGGHDAPLGQMVTIASLSFSLTMHTDMLTPPHPLAPPPPNAPPPLHAVLPPVLISLLIGGIGTVLVAVICFLCYQRRVHHRTLRFMRASRDRAQMDVHMLSHQFDMHTEGGTVDGAIAVAPSLSPPPSNPPGPPSMCGSSHTASSSHGHGQAAASQAAGSVARAGCGHGHGQAAASQSSDGAAADPLNVQSTPFATLRGIWSAFAGSHQEGAAVAAAHSLPLLPLPPSQPLSLPVPQVPPSLPAQQVPPTPSMAQPLTQPPTTASQLPIVAATELPATTACGQWAAATLPVANALPLVCALPMASEVPMAALPTAVAMPMATELPVVSERSATATYAAATARVDADADARAAATFSAHGTINLSQGVICYGDGEATSGSAEGELRRVEACPCRRTHAGTSEPLTPPRVPEWTVMGGGTAATAPFAGEAEAGAASPAKRARPSSFPSTASDSASVTQAQVEEYVEMLSAALNCGNDDEATLGSLPSGSTREV
jgi:hypothetical protein